MRDVPSENRNRHFVGLAAGVTALVLTYVLSGGVVTYLIYIGVSVLAVLVGHYAVKRPGRTRWAAIVGLVLSYLTLVMSIGLLTVRLTLVLSNTGTPL
ncbi:hypothetical protein ACFWHR_04320 [Leucobacter sp. NPDC058333]|uniref:hypothetical protein n=1 Tax=Leucobacter sp. NPDC058333 TaxID=3346450 RepID=UPI003658E69A